jgi:hypothetical protein
MEESTLLKRFNRFLELIHVQKQLKNPSILSSKKQQESLDQVINREKR